MKKNEIVGSLIGCEFYFTDYGVCGLRKNGDVVHWGEVCEVENDKGQYVKANLYKLPKKWASAVQFSNLTDQWTEPDDTETREEILNWMIKEDLV